VRRAAGGWAAILGAGCLADPAGPGAEDTDVPLSCEDPSAPCDLVPPPPDQNPCGAGLFEAEGELVWPEQLSSLGCFSALSPLTPEPALLPYEVQVPLWSEGAEKRRWISLPPGGRIEADPNLPWSFPTGTLLLKSFALDLDETDAVPARLLEVRAMAQTIDGWRYATWRIDPSSGEGRRIGEQGEPEALVVRTADALQPVSWWYPSVVGCETCHRRYAEEVLGPRTAQLDRVVRLDGGWVRQIDAWAASGWLSEPVAEHGASLPRVDGAAPVAARARAWLDGQCAHCHLPGGFVSPDVHLDLRFDRTLAETGLCEPPNHASWGLPGELLVAPGDVEGSQLVHRLVPGHARSMPPGVERADAEGLNLIAEWISGLGACP
jgi:hypothetical protein